MTESTYNGWTNYETWAVGMHLGGNYEGEATYEYFREMAEAYEGNPYGLAEAIKDAIEESVIPEPYDGLRGDLLGAALSGVDWNELAGNQLQAVEA